MRGRTSAPPPGACSAAESETVIMLTDRRFLASFPLNEPLDSEIQAQRAADRIILKRSRVWQYQSPVLSASSTDLLNFSCPCWIRLFANGEQEGTHHIVLEQLADLAEPVAGFVLGIHCDIVPHPHLRGKSKHATISLYTASP